MRMTKYLIPSTDDGVIKNVVYGKASDHIDCSYNDIKEYI
jgi:hypothetical protein